VRRFDESLGVEPVTSKHVHYSMLVAVWGFYHDAGGPGRCRPVSAQGASLIQPLTRGGFRCGTWFVVGAPFGPDPFVRLGIGGGLVSEPPRLTVGGSR
jgi:hypothetical protein